MYNGHCNVFVCIRTCAVRERVEIAGEAEWIRESELLGAKIAGYLVTIVRCCRGQKIIIRKGRGIDSREDY